MHGTATRFTTRPATVTRWKMNAPIGMSTNSAHTDASTSAAGALHQAGCGSGTREAPTMIAAVAPKVSHRPTSAIDNGDAIRIATAVSAIAWRGAVR